MWKGGAPVGKIHELGFELANMIAAGEVVSRPASAIKELCENSIDAGATRISVEIQNGGVLLMRVTDNGCGMSPEDLALCTRRHATSKISCAKDIDAIKTMGFRGEALAALSAVTQLRIISKTADADYGHMLTSNFGSDIELTERGAATGTTVIAENLFMNMPARRKFLRRDYTEAGAVADCVEKLALSHPEIAFQYVCDGVFKFETSGNGRLDEVIYKVYGKENTKNLLKVGIKQNGVEVCGYIGSPMVHKVNRAYQAVFVNKRSVSCAMINSCITNAYVEYIPSDRHPIAVLFVNVNPLMVDVNVHPAKTEVKFSNDQDVYTAVYSACFDVLRDMEKMPEFSGKRKAGGDSSGEEVKKTSISQVAAPLTVNRDENGCEVKSSLEKNQLSFTASNPDAMNPPSAPARDKEKGEYIEAEKPREKLTPTKLNSESEMPVSDSELSSEDVAHYYYDEKEKTYKKYPGERILSDEDKTVSKEYEKSERREMTITEEKKSVRETEEARAVKESETEREKQLFESIPDSVKAPRRPLPKEFFQKLDLVPGNTPTFKDRDGEYGEGVYTSFENGQKCYHRVLGEIFNKYIIVEAVTRSEFKKMLIIDKHAAHERMLYERMKENLESEERTSQLMLVPVVADLGTAYVNRIRRNLESIEDLGFRLELCDKSVKIWSLPNGVRLEDAEEMLLIVLRSVEGGVRNNMPLPEIFNRSLFSLACKAAEKGGRESDAYTVDVIAKAVITDARIRFCPHGRPVVFEMELEELDGIFKRS